MDDLISRKEAIEWVQNILATHLYYHPRSKSRNVPIDEVIDRLERVPSIDAVPTASISRIEKELHGRDVEMQYEIIRWLWNYAKQFTDSRTAILQWLRGEES